MGVPLNHLWNPPYVLATKNIDFFVTFMPAVTALVSSSFSFRLGGTVGFMGDFAPEEWLVYSGKYQKNG